jgi:hypothetical protein
MNREAGAASGQGGAPRALSKSSLRGEQKRSLGARSIFCHRHCHRPLYPFLVDLPDHREVMSRSRWQKCSAIGTPQRLSRITCLVVSSERVASKVDDRLVRAGRAWARKTSRTSTSESIVVLVARKSPGPSWFHRNKSTRVPRCFGTTGTERLARSRSRVRSLGLGTRVNWSWWFTRSIGSSCSVRWARPRGLTWNHGAATTRSCGLCPSSCRPHE